ncbi:MAG: right-handed parallel beta-helix repeat-containing protein [Candidatus Nanoarchaeia archaeon]|nr:right-handed parallel beta-helix repeat-containing protein [Candidatus Nanoarchaeia archaeon]
MRFKIKKLMFVFLFVVFFVGMIIPNVLAAEYIYPQDYGATGDGTKNNPWANDCIDKAIAAASEGDTIYLKAGYYQLSGECVIKEDNLTVMGAGMGKTIVLTDDAHGFLFFGRDYITIADMTIDGTAQEYTYKLYGIYPANCDYTTIRNVEIKNCNSCGINNFQTNYGLYENLSLHDNGEHGIHPASNHQDLNMYNTYRYINAYNNTKCGFDDRGSYTQGYSHHNLVENIHCWGNGLYGIIFEHQDNSILSSSSSHDNARYDIYIKDLDDFTFKDCTYKTIYEYDVNYK